MRKYYRNHFTQ